MLHTSGNRIFEEKISEGTGHVDLYVVLDPLCSQKYSYLGQGKLCTLTTDTLSPPLTVLPLASIFVRNNSRWSRFHSLSMRNVWQVLACRLIQASSLAWLSALRQEWATIKIRTSSSSQLSRERCDGVLDLYVCIWTY